MQLVQHRDIILASGSPRRKEYLEKFNLQFSVITSDIDETALKDEDPDTYARRMASEKARAVEPLCLTDGVVIAADTIVVHTGKILGKPENRDEVLPMLHVLNGKRHQVITAYQILDLKLEKHILRSVLTEVRFNQLSEEILKAYAESEEPLDKAGAYSIQGLGTLLVQTINGSYNNVVGLPIELVLQDLIDLNVISTK